MLWCHSLRGHLICAVAKLALAIKFFYICGILTMSLNDHLLGSEQVISACLKNNQISPQFTKLGLNQVPQYPNIEIRSQCSQFGTLRKNNSFNFVFNENLSWGSVPPINWSILARGIRNPGKFDLPILVLIDFAQNRWPLSERHHYATIVPEFWSMLHYCGWPSGRLRRREDLSKQSTGWAGGVLETVMVDRR